MRQSIQDTTNRRSSKKKIENKVKLMSRWQKNFVMQRKTNQQISSKKALSKKQLKLSKNLSKRMKVIRKVKFIKLRRHVTTKKRLLNLITQSPWCKSSNQKSAVHRKKRER